MVIAKRMEPLVTGSSIIRKLFEEGKEMAKKVGTENVYDYSLGNPSVPAPDAVKSSIIQILDTEDPLFVHGYMSNSGYEEVRQAVADNLNERFQWQYKMEDIIMTVGAASGIFFWTAVMKWSPLHLSLANTGTMSSPQAVF